MIIEIKISVGGKPFQSCVDLSVDGERKIFNVFREAIAKFQSDLDMFQTSPERYDFDFIERATNFPFPSSFTILSDREKAEYVIKKKSAMSRFSRGDIATELKELDPNINTKTSTISDRKSVV